MHVHARTCARMCAYDLHAGMSLELVPLSAAARVEQHSLRHVAVRHPLLQLLPPSKILPHTGCHHTGYALYSYGIYTYDIYNYSLSSYGLSSYGLSSYWWLARRINSGCHSCLLQHAAADCGLWLMTASGL